MKKEKRTYIDFSQVIRLPGKGAIKNSSADDQMTMAKICVGALNYFDPKVHLTYEAAYTRGRLARRVSKGGKIGLVDTEVEMIKELLPHVCPNVVLSLVSDMLDGEDTEAEEAEEDEAAAAGEATSQAA